MSTPLTQPALVDVISHRAASTSDVSRQEALKLFQSIGLPGRKSEEYKFTPITAALEKNVDWQQPTGEGQFSSITPFLIDGVESHVVVLVNGVFSAALSSIQSLPKGLTIVSLKDALASNSKASEVFNTLFKNTTDSFAALNTALWTDGVFIHVATNSTVEKPVLLLHLQDAAQQVIQHTRALVVVENNSSLQLMEKSASMGDKPVFHTFSEEIFVGDQAALHYVKIQQDEGSLYQVNNSIIRQQPASRVNTFTLTLEGKIIRNNLTILIDGENCESHFHGLYAVRGQTLVDHHTVVDHRQPNSYSNELYKGIMDDQSKGVFNGKIFVRPHAQKTNAFQSNRNILLTDTATINTKPQLEIWADDVKCSHGCTTGQLDEEALFYLRSRGIPSSAAKALLLHAFAAETLTYISDEALKNYLDRLITERLHQEF